MGKGTHMAHTYVTYYNEVLNDAKAALDENMGYYDSFQKFYDDLWVDDSVTGNGSGSYYFNAYKASKAVSEFLWTEECHELLSELCVDVAKLMEDGPESADVTVRCCMLGHVAKELKDYWDEVHEDNDEENE